MLTIAQDRLQFAVVNETISYIIVGHICEFYIAIYLEISKFFVSSEIQVILYFVLGYNFEGATLARGKTVNQFNLKNSKTCVKIQGHSTSRSRLNKIEDKNRNTGYVHSRQQR